jgi:hypothetical protein
MDVVIRRIDEPVTAKLRTEVEQWESRFPIDFDSDCCSGQSHLCVLHTSPFIDLDAVRKQVIGKTLHLDVSAERVSEFNVVGDVGSERVAYLGRRGLFRIEGRVAKHLISGIGSIVQSGPISLVIDREMVSSDCFDIDEGTWIRFVAEGMSLWAPL